MRSRDLTKVDERRNAARFLGIPALLAHPRNLAVSRTHAAPAGRLRTGLLSVAVLIGLVIVVASSVDLAVSVGGAQPIAAGTSTIVQSHLGPGYPEHHGLAGPSRVGPSAGSWLGYPPHFGLAGPSRAKSGAVLGIGVGYPPHYGLAGPSHVDDGG
jgi:hypothetical protein